MKHTWYVVIRKETTKKETSKQGFFYEKDAMTYATQFNRYSQDTTWNAERAYVEKA